MTVAELRYALADLDDDATVYVIDGDNAFTFGPDAVSQHRHRVAGRVVWIDLTHPSCEAAGAGPTTDPPEESNFRVDR